MEQPADADRSPSALSSRWVERAATACRNRILRRLYVVPVPPGNEEVEESFAESAGFADLCGLLC